MIRRFYLKVLLLGLPFLLMSATYFVFDPFMVLHKYDRYDVAGAYLNEAVVGWETYSTYRDSLHYNSFVLGNSCTIAFRTEAWEKYLDGDRALRLFDNSECLGGVCHKLEALDANGAEINNVLIALDPRSMREYTPNDTFKHVLPPAASGISAMQFHLKFLQGYLYPDVIVPYLHYKITGEVTPYMLRKYIVSPYILREAFTNNGVNPHEAEIAELGEKYWEQAGWLDFRETTPEGYYAAEIFPDQIRCLEKIREICDRHNADLKFIVSPHYGISATMHPQDIEHLRRTLGDKSVVILLGDSTYSSDPHDYYEPDHYRPRLGERILRDIYTPEAATQTPPAADSLAE